MRAIDIRYNKAIVGNKEKIGINNTRESIEYFLANHGCPSNIIKNGVLPGCQNRLDNGGRNGCEICWRQEVNVKGGN